MSYESANSVRERTSNWGRFPPLDKVVKNMKLMDQLGIDQVLHFNYSFFTQASPLKKVFNRTMSLRHDSDIVVKRSSYVCFFNLS